MAMPGTLSHDRLIGGLAADLQPVNPLRGFGWRAAAWLGVVAVMGGLLALIADMTTVTERLMAAPDLWLAASGSALTAILGAIAAFQLSLPDRKPLWALLPLPGLALWLGASGLGCLRNVVEMGLTEEIFAESKDCLVVILALSLPLSAALIAMLRRGYSLRPNFTGLLAGVAVAGASVALLNLVHPHDPSIISIAVHGMGIALVALANRLTGGRIFSR